MSALLLYPDDMSVNDESAHPATQATSPGALPATTQAATQAASPAEEPCVDWMRIFAARLAQQCQELSAEEVIRVAITEFKISHCLPPEDAAALCAQRHVAGG